MPIYNIAGLNEILEAIPKQYRGHVLIGMVALLAVFYVANAFGFLRFAFNVLREIWTLIFGRIGR